MTDERERRFRARIDLKTGRHEVIETHPVDRRTAATIPPTIQVPERVEPPRTVEPSTAPLFPWQRAAAPTVAPPQQETAQPMWQPPEIDPMQQVHDVWPPPPMPDQQSASEVPWTGTDPLLDSQHRMHADAQAQSDGTDLQRQAEDRFVEQLVDRVMERIRAIYRLPPDEPPVLGAEHNPALDAVMLAYSPGQYHPAGAYASTPRPRVYHPAGAFANQDT